MTGDTTGFGRDGAGYQEVMIPTLPLLPEVPGHDYRPGGRSILSLLADEHEQLMELSGRLVGSADPQSGLTSVVSAAVSRHLSAEEQYLYPTVRAVLPQGASIQDREIDRDAHILRQLATLETLPPGSLEFRDLATAIDADLHRHHEACASQIFPQLHDAVDEVDLIRLGNRVEIAQEAAPTRPHPDTPAKPPWNKVTDPAIGVVDKIRDVMDGRKTYPEDL